MEEEVNDWEISNVEEIEDEEDEEVRSENEEMFFSLYRK